MSKHRSPCSLYSGSLERLQLLIADYAVDLAQSGSKTAEIQEIVDDWKLRISARLPRRVLEDVCNTFDGAILKSSRELCFYYLLTMRDDFQRLEVSKVNSTFSIYEWNELFVRHTFDQLTWLDCGRNCTDHVLYLISMNCPNLEYLNASSRRKTFVMGTNATLLHDRITDIGIELIAQRCRKLRTLIMNDPRNGGDSMSFQQMGGGGRRQSIHTLSTSGYRLLLRSVPSLECISYANIGGIVASELGDVTELNLKLIQHYNPTKESIREILRLCRKLEKLHLVSFVSSPTTQEVLDELVMDVNKPPLTTVNFKNMSVHTAIPKICDTFRHLVELNVTESFDYLSGDALLVIGTELAYLKHLHLIGYCPSAGDSFRNKKFLGQLERLTISYVDAYSEPALKFCVSNSEATLRHCSLAVDTGQKENTVRNLMDKHTFPVLYELVLLPGFVTSMEEVLDLITHFPQLERFTGWCLGDISPIACLIQEHNLNFTFTNIKQRTLLD